MVKIHEFSGLVCMHAGLAQPQARPCLKHLTQIISCARSTTGETIRPYSTHQISNHILQYSKDLIVQH